MKVFTHEKASEDFLNDGGLMSKITQVFIIEVFDLLFFELFSGVMSSELGLYFDCCGFFALKLLSFEVHFEFGLNFESSLIVAFPIFLGLIGAVVVKLDGKLEKRGLLLQKVHKKKFQLVIFI